MAEQELHEQLERKIPVAPLGLIVIKIPVAPLGLIVMPSAQELGTAVDRWLITFRQKDHNIAKKDPAFRDYVKESYQIPVQVPRFGSGEGKAVLPESVRGYDIMILTDVTNHSLTYRMNGFLNHMSPDDHFQDLKRVIAFRISNG